MVSIKNLSLFFVLAFGFSHEMMYADLAIPGKGKKIAVFTDYEADDSVAIGLLLQYLRNHHVQDSNDFMIDALLSNQYRKKALAQKLVGLFGYDADAVCAGTGGIKEPFEQEGCNILSQNQLDEFLILDQKYLESQDPAMHQDDEACTHFLTLLADAAPNSIDVILLTNPIDFVRAIENNLDALRKIRTIYMMGGWFGTRPSFNWNMYIDSVVELLQLMKSLKGDPCSPELVLFSSHFFAQEFNGYVNQAKFPEVIQAFDTNTNPIVCHLRHMVKNWDDSMTVIKDHHDAYQREWRLEMVDRIGKENIGRQFAPADPATMLGYLYPEEFIVSKVPCSIQLKVTIDGQGRKNSTVNCSADASSNVFVVEKVDLSFFQEKLVGLMGMPA